MNTYTVYAVHLLKIKFGKLVCDMNWLVFSSATKAFQIMYVYGRV